MKRKTGLEDGSCFPASTDPATRRSFLCTEYRGKLSPICKKCGFISEKEAKVRFFLTRLIITLPWDTVTTDQVFQRGVAPLMLTILQACETNGQSHALNDGRDQPLIMFPYLDDSCIADASHRRMTWIVTSRYGCLVRSTGE